MLFGVGSAQNAFLAARSNSTIHKNMTESPNDQCSCTYTCDCNTCNEYSCPWPESGKLWDCSTCSYKPFIGEIRWHGQQDTCMDVAGGRSDNGNKIQAWECTGSVSQLFSYDPDEPMPQIKWMGGAQNKCLDVHFGNTDNFADVVLYDCHPMDHPDRSNQAFIGDDLGRSGWAGQIKWQPHPEKCLDLNDGVVGSVSQSNSKVVTHSCHNFGDQDWDHQMWNAINKDDVAKCEAQLSADSCLKSSDCDWCGRPPESCYNKVKDPLACAN